MMTSVVTRSGRKSKGDRRYFGTRLPIAHAALLIKEATARNVYVSDFIAQTVIEKLEFLKQGQETAGPSVRQDQSRE